MNIKEKRNGVGNPAIEHESCVRVIDRRIVGYPEYREVGDALWEFAGTIR